MMATSLNDPQQQAHSHQQVQVGMVAAARVSRGTSRTLCPELGTNSPQSLKMTAPAQAASPHDFSIGFRGRCHYTLRWEWQHQHPGFDGQTASSDPQESLEKWRTVGVDGIGETVAL